MRPVLRPAAALLALLGAFLLPATAARAQDSSVKVKAEAKVEPAEGIEAGKSARLEVTLSIDPGWHVYAPGDEQETTFRITGGAEKFTVGPFTLTSKAREHKSEWDDGPRLELEGEASFVSVVLIPAGTPPGRYTLKGVAAVNACDASMCFPPGEAPFTAVLVVLPGPAASAVAPAPVPVPAPPPPPAMRPEIPNPPDPESEGTLGFLLTAVIAGLLTIATPCVFPMIPLTVSLLTKRAEKEPEKVLRNALAYGAGMFVSLAGVGLAMSLVFGVAPSDLALSPGFNLAIFLFLGVLSLSLFGAFDLALPAFLTDWSQSKTGTGGGGGLFFMGMTLAFTSFACAAPFAGVLVVQARTDVGRGILGMSVYAGTFTLPFFLTALFPGLLKKLPRSGGWLNAVKVCMGFVEVAAAFKFLRNADQLWDWGFFSFELVLAIWIACALGAFLYLIGLIVLPHDTKPESIGVARLLWALAFLAAALYLLPGLSGRRINPFVEAFIIRDEVAAAPGIAIPNGVEKGELRWIKNDLDAAMAEAGRTGRPVFVDFTGFG